MIEAAEVAENLSPIGGTLPKYGRTVRPLVKLQPEQQREAWAAAVAVVFPKRVEEQLHNIGDNLIWLEAGGPARRLSAAATEKPVVSATAILWPNKSSGKGGAV